MTSDDDRLDDDVAALLRQETADTSLPGTHVARARERLELRLGLGAVGAVGAGAAATTGKVDSTSNTSAKAAGGKSEGAGAAGENVFAAGAKSVSRGVLGAVATTTFVMGIATGWVASRTLERTEASDVRASSSPAATTFDAPPPRPSVAPIDEPPTSPSPVAPPISPASPSSVPPSAPTSRVGPSSIAVDTSKEERALLDQARRALNEGDGERALLLVETHAKSFPRGALAEERDVLRIQALAAVGQVERARTAVEAFRKKYPASPFLPAVESRLPAP